ncbi:hypothetical protein IAT38_005137 [Cryptococcus sp. DSM 104549]
MSAPLTKKQQKALAFRSKQKAKKAGAEEPADLPEEDVMQDDEEVVVEEEKVVSKGDKKRKRTGEEDGDDAEAGEAGGEEEKGAKGKEGEKKKRKTAWDEEEGGEEAKKGKGRKDAKQRFILFVGNLGFKTTREEVAEHFKPATGNLPAVRLLSTKATPTQPAKSRGIAFLELPSSSAMQECLKLHHSNLKGRTINVELTAGGGGAGEERKRKIGERNKRVGEQREKRAEREREEGGGEESAAAGGAGGAGKGEAAEPAKWGVGADGEKVKVRGGRRVKAKKAKAEGESTDAAPPKRFPQPHAERRAPPSSGYQGGNQGGHGKFQKKKWTPTGANAVTVG